MGVEVLEIKRESVEQSLERFPWPSIPGYVRWVNGQVAIEAKNQRRSD